ncbi:ATP-dependent helicase HrpB [Nocardioidaceae bacterium]|nr:ATP-dependent helicase HrpB [Nocardioidaceae bacterium]
MPDPIRRLLENPPDLPVAAGLSEVAAALGERGAVVLQAPPGSGKTTLVPPAVADGVGGRVVVTAPRRIAARAAASRLASLMGEHVGETVGYTVRDDRRVSRSTRIEVVTDGILLRRLQHDPELPGVDAVVLDEVHERHLDGDLALAFTLDVRAHLRPDLQVVAMSATIEAERTAALLGSPADPAPVVTVPGSLHPVERVWAPPPTSVLRTDERGVTPAFLDHVAVVVRRALAEQAGDVLVFVPGIGEVGGVVHRLTGLPDTEVLPLHGRLSSTEQDRVLQPVRGRRRVVVSTAVAESSLTVPGVRVVVDAGLARRPETDHRRGLSGLVTVRASRAAADQRAGRAGREAPGAAYRCWGEADHAHLPAHPEPEVATADLTAYALELAAWGEPDGSGLALPDAPPPAAFTAAREALVDLGAVDADGALTDRGRAMVGMPVDPRLARALLEGAPLVGSRRAAEVVAMLAEEVRVPGGDLVAGLRRSRGDRAGGAWRRTRVRLERMVGNAESAEPAERLPDDLTVGLVAALVHPGRVARRRAGTDSTTYLMASGTGAVLPRGSELAGAPWLVVADADRRPGARDATIRLAAAISEEVALEAAATLWTETDEVTWADGRLVARTVVRLGAIELSSSPLPDPPVEAVTAALRSGFRRDGLDVLPWSSAARALRQRLAFLRRALGDPWPDVSDDALLDDLEGWLGHELGRVRSATDLRRIDVLAALRGLLPWPEATRLDELAPERLTVPSGSSVALDYAPDSGGDPVLAVRVQEVFGLSETPRLADGRVPVVMHLLSPARRPAAVTSDLASFWVNGYPGVRADLRGRYPKHAWPEDPTTAEPARGVRRRG